MKNKCRHDKIIWVFLESRDKSRSLCTSADFTIESTCRRCGKSRWILLCLTIKINSTHETMYFSFQRGAMYKIGSEVILHNSGIKRHKVEFSLNLWCWNARERGKKRIAVAQHAHIRNTHTYTLLLPTHAILPGTSIMCSR